MVKIETKVSINRFVHITLHNTIIMPIEYIGINKVDHQL